MLAPGKMTCVTTIAESIFLPQCSCLLLKRSHLREESMTISATCVAGYAELGCVFRFLDPMQQSAEAVIWQASSCSVNPSPDNATLKMRMGTIT